MRAAHLGPRIPLPPPAVASPECDSTVKLSGGSLCGPLAEEAQAMAVDARIRELGNRHRTLDEQIQREVTRPTADSLHVRELKQRKLRIKEEISALEARV